jgi:hypothetical protein
MFENIDFKDNEYTNNINFLNFVNDLYEGTRTIKLSGQRYLNKYSMEEDQNYFDRLQTATLYNVFKKSIDNTASMLLRKKPNITAPEQNMSLLKNVDGTGTSIDSFIKEIGKLSILDGLSYIWVDSQNIDGTVTEFSKSQIKPFFKIIKRSDVINKSIVFKDGVAVLDTIVFTQLIDEKIDNFKTIKITATIVLTAGTCYILKGKEILVQWENTLGYVPIIPVYSAKKGFLSADIPFLDLAYMNIKHYNSQSNLDSILKVAALPVPIIFSANEYDKNSLKKEGVTVGVNRALSFSDKSSEGFEWAEISGSSISALESNLEKIEEKMEKMSISMVLNSSFNTATEAKISDANSNIFLLELAFSIDSAINNAFLIAGEYSGTDYGISIELSKDFSGIAMDAQTIDKIINMKAQGLISLDTFWDAMIKGEIISILNYDVEKQKIIDEANNA